MKVVLNADYGGFRLTSEMCAEYQRLTGQNISEWGWFLGGYVPRHDPALVCVVEAHTGHSLVVVDVPKGTRYRIAEYDGREWIEARDAMEWQVAD